MASQPRASPTGPGRRSRLNSEVILPANARHSAKTARWLAVSLGAPGCRVVAHPVAIRIAVTTRTTRDRTGIGGETGARSTFTVSVYHGSGNAQLLLTLCIIGRGPCGG